MTMANSTDARSAPMLGNQEIVEKVQTELGMVLMDSELDAKFKSVFGDNYRTSGQEKTEASAKAQVSVSRRL